MTPKLIRDTATNSLTGRVVVEFDYRGAATNRTWLGPVVLGTAPPSLAQAFGRVVLWSAFLPAIRARLAAG